MQTKMTRDPNGEQLYVNLRDSILNGKLKTGDRLLSSREFQKKFDISYRATLAALDRLGRDGFVVRKQGSGTYVADAANRPNNRGNSRTIQVLASFVSPIAELFSQPLLSEVRKELEILNCNCSISVLRKERAWSEKEWCQKLYAACENETGDVLLHICPSYPFKAPPPTRPTIFVAQDMEAVWAKENGYDVVAIDDRQCGAIVAKHLKSIGCKQVATVGAHIGDSKKISPYSYQRFRGFEIEWVSAIPESHAFFAQNYSAACGAEVVPRILTLDSLPDAIFADTDDLAHGICHALIAHGLQPGKDIKVVGFDGMPALYPDDPILTSVAAPMKELGKVAAQMALQRAEDPGRVTHRILLAGTLRKGDTA